MDGPTRTRGHPALPRERANAMMARVRGPDGAGVSIRLLVCVLALTLLVGLPAAQAVVRDGGGGSDRFTGTKRTARCSSRSACATTR